MHRHKSKRNIIDEISLRNIIYDEVKKRNIMIAGTGEKYHCLNFSDEISVYKNFIDTSERFHWFYFSNWKESLVNHQSIKNITDIFSVTCIMMFTIWKNITFVQTGEKWHGKYNRQKSSTICITFILYVKNIIGIIN